jgi:hypothetical protein
LFLLCEPRLTLTYWPTHHGSVNMAWKTPAGQKKPSQPARKKGDGSFPGLKTPGKPEIKTPYEELQVDEVTALQAIYGDDFIEHKTTSAWKVWPMRRKTKLHSARDG